MVFAGGQNANRPSENQYDLYPLGTRATARPSKNNAQLIVGGLGAGDDKHKSLLLCFPGKNAFVPPQVTVQISFRPQFNLKKNKKFASFRR